MLNGGLLQVTGRGTNVNFTIDDQAPFEAVIAGVEECLVKNRHLFSRGNITVNVGRRILAREQLTQIKRILEAESGLTVAQFWCSPEILEETLSDIAPEQLPETLDEVLGENTPIDNDSLPECQPNSESPDSESPDSEYSPSRLGLEGSETPDEAAENPGQFLGWPTPDFSAISGPSAAASPLIQEEESPESENEPLSLEDSGDVENQSSPEAEAYDDSLVPAEPAAQISPDSADDQIPEPGSQTAIEPTIEPFMEPSPLELALLGLEQSITKGGLDSDQDGSTASLESKLDSLPPESLPPESLPPEADLGEVGLGIEAPSNTGVETSISPQPETGGLNRKNEALLIKTTCRSGEVVRYPGDVVILADVNPGAEIIADGDILVFGNLRGLAHAGAGGDIQATIVAVNLESPRIQIGPYIGMAPKAKKRGKSYRAGPTLAFVRRQHIFVAPFKGRFEGYSGGTLYDG